MGIALNCAVRSLFLAKYRTVTRGSISVRWHHPTDGNTGTAAAYVRDINGLVFGEPCLHWVKSESV